MLARWNRRQQLEETHADEGWNVEVQDKPCVAVKDFEVKDQELIEMVRDQEVLRHDTDKASFLSSSRDSANSTGATCKHIE